MADFALIDSFLDQQRYSSVSTLLEKENVVMTRPSSASPIFPHDQDLLEMINPFHQNGHTEVPSNHTLESSPILNQNPWMAELDGQGVGEVPVISTPVLEPKRKHVDSLTGEVENKGEKRWRKSSERKNALEPQSRKQKKVPQQPVTGYVHVRARRGEATDPHSLAERVRRKKISMRMKLLQSLVPGCDKITGKALILDEITRYVVILQNQVRFLAAKLAFGNGIGNSFDEVHYDRNIILPEGLFSSELQEWSSTQLVVPPIETAPTTMLHHQEATNGATQLHV